MAARARRVNKLPLPFLYPTAGSNARRFHVSIMNSVPSANKAPQLCRLCQQAPPIENSHILSRFLWKQSRLAHRDDNKGYKLIHKGQSESSVKYEKSGIQQPILCQSCEQARNKIETSMSALLYHRRAIVRSKSAGHQIIDGLPYAQVKLFTMYNLFMMGVSEHPFYKEVKLGGSHTDRLRKMLLSSDPGEDWRYSSIWFRLKLKGEPLEGIGIAPSQIRWGDSGQVVYRTVIAGICWMTFCSNHPHPWLKEPLYIGKPGRLVLFDAAPNEMPFIAHRIDEWLVNQGHPAIYSLRR
jgi:hypothetical protein